jgi:tripartite-type tricarboxylate transporter receptor subunit TctC
MPSVSTSDRVLEEISMKIARQVVLGAAVALAAFGRASAQDWPTRNVTVVVPIPAGVASDIIARVVFEQVGRQVGQTFVIENRPGAGGTIGANMVAKAAPDGHTILVYGSIAAANALYTRLPYDTVADFTPVVPFGETPAGRGDGGGALQHAGRAARCCEGQAR